MVGLFSELKIIKTMNKKYPLAISFGRAMKFRELGIFQHTEYCYIAEQKTEELKHIESFLDDHSLTIIKSASVLEMAPVFTVIMEKVNDVSAKLKEKYGQDYKPQFLYNADFVFDCIMDCIEQNKIDLNEIKLILAKEAQDNQQSQTNH